MTLFTVGFGARIPTGGLHPLPAAKTLADLEAEVALARRVYNMPDSAGICRPAPGSVYLFELTWVEAAARQDPAPPGSWQRDVADVTEILPNAPAEEVARLATLIGRARTAERRRVLDDVAGER